MRRVHRKARTGCSQCKRRRVKCDERKPTCKGCERNHLQCSLEFLTPMSSLSRGNTRVKAFSQQMVGRPTLGLLDLYMDDQSKELMHHYMDSVFISHPDSQRRFVWAITIPQMGLEHAFLLSGIKAVTALHLATLVPQRKEELQSYAVAETGTALRSFRMAMTNPNGEIIHASCAFAGVAIYYILTVPEANSLDPHRIPSKNDEHPHWFQMMRARSLLYAKNWDTLTKGPFAPLLKWNPASKFTLDKSDDQHFVELEEICHSPPRTSGAPSLVSSPEYRREAEVCKEAIQGLREASAVPNSKVATLNTRTLCDKTAIVTWPGYISQDFLELIYRQDPRALIILAHYCILLKRHEYVWCLRGVGLGLLENIWHAVGEEWRPWLQWPMEGVCKVPKIRNSYTFTLL